MEVRRVLLENFMPHEEREITFTQGINLIVGPNGSGKSAVLEAIYVALFGFPGFRFRRKVDYIRRGANSFRVEVELGDPDALVILTDRESSFTTGDSTERGGVPGIIREVYGLSRKRFLRTVFARQGDIAGIISLTPSERAEELAVLLGAQAARRLEEEFSSAVSAVQETLPEEIKEIEEEVREIGKRLTEIGKKKRDLGEMEEGILRSLREVVDRRRKLEETRKRAVRLSEIRAKLEELRKLKGRVPELSRRLETLRKEVEELSPCEKEYIRLTEELAVLKKRSEELRERLKRARKAEERLAKLPGDDVSLLETEIQKKRNEYAKLSAELAEVKKKGKLLVKSEAKCPLCGSPLDRAKKEKLLSDFRKKVEQLSSEIRRIEEEGRKLSARLARAKEAEGLRQKLLAVLEEVGKAESLSEELEKVSSRVEELERRAVDLEKKLELLSGKRREMEAVKGELDFIRKSMASAEPLRREAEKLVEEGVQFSEEEWKAIQEEVERLHRKLASVKASVGELTGEEKSLAERKRKLEEQLEKHRKLAGGVETATRLKRALSRFSRAVVTAAGSALPAVVNDVVRAFGFGFSVVITPEMEIKVVSGEGEEDLGFLSGAQSMVLGLAFRIALARLTLAGRRVVLILDEPTYGLDAERMDALKRILRAAVDSGAVPQVIMVTHEESFAEIADNVVNLGGGT